MGLSNERIYVSEKLPPYLRDILILTRRKGRELAYRYIWVKNGSVKARKNDETEIV